MLFFVAFYSIYGLLHLYVFVKTGSAFTFSRKEKLSIVVLMAIMLFSPSIIHYFEKAGLGFPARVMSYVGYLWMGALVLFIYAAAFIDIYRLLVYLAGLVFRGKLSSISPTARQSFIVSILFALIISSYGFFEARDIHVERFSINSSKMAGLGKIKIVQISDVHLGLIVREERLRRIIDVVKKENPDILVSTGDLVDGQINDLEGLAEMLQEVKPGYGKFAVTGNHEFYAGLKQSLDFTKRAISSKVFNSP